MALRALFPGALLVETKNGCEKIEEQRPSQLAYFNSVTPSYDINDLKLISKSTHVVIDNAAMSEGSSNAETMAFHVFKCYR